MIDTTTVNNRNKIAAKLRKSWFVFPLTQRHGKLGLIIGARLIMMNTRAARRRTKRMILKQGGAMLKLADDVKIYVTEEIVYDEDMGDIMRDWDAIFYPSWVGGVLMGEIIVFNSKVLRYGEEE